MESSNNTKGVSVANAVDMIAKLTAPIAVLIAALIANNFQASITATNLLNQREQADSNLRAAMFKELVNPIIGQNKQGLTRDQEQLLVELLALNFHEHFELKPMLLHLDERLRQERDTMDQETWHRSRSSLLAAVRQVKERQVAMLTRGTNDESGATEQAARVYRLDLCVHNKPSGGKGVKMSCKENDHSFDNLFVIPSPNGKYELTFTFGAPDWNKRSFPVQVIMHPKEDTPNNKVNTAANEYHDNIVRTADRNFTLTEFNFPYTDNTVLADGTRFALIADNVYPTARRAEFKLIWFPQDYFPDYERPINHRQFRERLGLRIGNS